jgi:GTP-binding protein
MLKLWLVWPTNAWKSLLFNHLLWSHRAIVTDIAGTTRELLRDETKIARYPVEIIDSPGLLDFTQEAQFLEQIIQEADILLFVVDGKLEVGSKEHDIHQMICKAGKMSRTILVVNKLDGKIYSNQRDMLLAQRYVFGYEYVCGISAEQYEWMEDLFEILVPFFQTYAEWQWATLAPEKPNDKIIHLAIVGKPNAWKSTLLNKLAGEDISFVSPTPGTTLDYLRATFTWKWTPIQLYDTAGIRKKGKTIGLERIAYEKTKSLLSYVHPITIVLIDLEEWLTKRDASLIQDFQEISGPMIVAVNKIDLFEPQEAAKKLKIFQQRVKVPSWIPMVPISWKNAIALPKLMNLVMLVDKSWKQRVPTPELNTVLTRAWLTKPPRFPKNKMCKRKYITQVKVAPPTFMVSVNRKDYANFSFISWMEKVIREWFGFQWSPIRLEIREKKDDNPYAGNYDT